MFRAKNFCHIASNNRNNVKVGVFVYRTTDNLATVLVSGYFNERIIDINLHDIIIHEKIDATDNTKVEKNVLCVTERTLDNVGTTVIKSKWEGDIEQEIEDLRTYVNNNFVKIDGTSIMTGPLKMRASISFECAIAPYWHGVGFYGLNDDDSVSLLASMERDDGFCPSGTSVHNIGSTYHKWKNLYLGGVAYLSKINNGYDIAVPVTNSADTLALKSQVDDAANSGEQLYTTGVWYAKMYAATVVPSSAEVEGRNYADFSQVDGQGDPIIVIYTYTSGAWATTATITPPKNHNGYMTITSKIWDISEQAGQQGGKVLWSHSQGTFTPYPQIISFENAALTGTPTAPTPTNDSPNNQIANKEYVDNATAGSGYHPDLFDVKWADHICNDVQWLRADTFSWQSGAVYQAAYQHLADDIDGKTLQSETIGSTTIQFYLADDGHKICPASEESNVSAIYNSTGVAWYYIIDTANTRFKLPRTQFAFTGIRNGVGGFVEAGLPNITGDSPSIYAESSYTANGAFGKTTTTRKVYKYSVNGTDFALDFDASRSSSVYGNSDTVQPKATEMYLYFYVGNFTQTAIENTAGLNASLFNNKADLDLNNVNSTGISFLWNKFKPDFTNLANITTSGYVASADGYLLFNNVTCPINQNIVFSINGVGVFRVSHTSTWIEKINAIIPISAGDVITWTSSISADGSLNFVPLKANS